MVAPCHRRRRRAGRATACSSSNEIDVSNINEMVKFVNNNGKPRIMRWGKSGFDPKVRIPEFMTVPDFKALMQNRAIYKDVPATRELPARTIRVPLAKHWLEDPTRYTYDGLVFDSKRNSKDEINLWRGFGISPRPAIGRRWKSILKRFWRRATRRAGNTSCTGSRSHSRIRPKAPKWR